MSLISFQIGGVERTCSIGTLNISDVLNDRKTMSATVQSYTPSIGADVVVRDEDGTIVFGGTVESYQMRSIGKSLLYEDYEVDISASDYQSLPSRRLVTEAYASQSLKARLTALVSTYLAGFGVTLSGSQVTGPTLEATTYDHRNLQDVLNELYTLTQYVWKIDDSKVLSMYLPSGSLPAPFDLLDSDTLSVLAGDVLVEPSRDQYANRVIVRAGTPGTAPVQQIFAGDGVSTVFPLVYPYRGNRGYLVVDGVDELIGSGATWDYDSGTNSIVRTSAPTNGAVIVFDFDAQFPIFRQADDTGEQGSNGIWEIIIDKPDVFDWFAAQTIANNELLLRVLTKHTVTYPTRERGAKAGQTQQIVVSDRGINGGCLITEVNASNPEKEQTLLYTIKAVVSGAVDSWRDVVASWGGASSGIGGAAGSLAIIQQSSGQDPSGNIRAHIDTSDEVEIGVIDGLGPAIDLPQPGIRIGPRIGASGSHAWDIINRVSNDGRYRELAWYDNYIGAGNGVALALYYWALTGSYILGPSSRTSKFSGGIQLGMDSNTDRFLAGYFDSEVYSAGGFRERFRSTKMGEPENVAYASGNFSQDTGTWTVDSGDQSVFRIKKVGTTATVTLALRTTSVSGSPTELRVTMPFTSAAKVEGVARCLNGAAVGDDTFFAIAASANTLVFGRSGGASWPNSTNQTFIWVEFDCPI